MEGMQEKNVKWEEMSEQNNMESENEKQTKNTNGVVYMNLLTPGN
jgi:hypothetical protein